jgi:epidermal growth factor receptor substrate 15
MQRPTVTPSDDERALIRRILAQTNSLEAGYLQTEVAIDVLNRSGLSRLELRDVWKLSDADSNGRITQDELAVAIRLMGWMQSGRPFSEALLEKRTQIAPYYLIQGLLGCHSWTTTSSGRHCAPYTSPEGSHTISYSGISACGTSRAARVSQYLRGRRPDRWVSRRRVIRPSKFPTSDIGTGEKVRDIYLKSNLAYRDLSSVWVLLDTTRRGRLNFLEFALGMYLIKAIRSCHLNGVPSSVPSEVRSDLERVANELQSPFLAPGEALPMPMPTASSPSRPTPPSRTPPAPPTKAPRVPPKPPPVKPKPGSKPWAVPPQERARYEDEFSQLGSGYISREVAWDHFRHYNLVEDEIAQIVHLASIRNDGHLNSDEFVVAMHLLQNKLNGKPIPTELPPSLIPPSLRQSSSSHVPTLSMSSPSMSSRIDSVSSPPPSTLRQRSASQVARTPSAFYLVTPSEVLSPQSELQRSPSTYAPSFDGILYPPQGNISMPPGMMSRRSTLSFLPASPEDDPLEELKAENKTLRRQIDNLLDQVSSQNDVRKENDTLRSENAVLKEKVTELEANVASVIMQMQHSDNALVEELGKEIERLTKRVHQLSETETHLLRATGDLETSRRNIATLGSQIRELRRKDAEHKAEMEDAKHAMEDLEGDNKDLKTRLEDLIKSIASPDMKDSKSSSKQLKVQLQEMTRENNTLKDRIRESEKSMESLLISQDASKSEEIRRQNRELQMQVQELEQLAAQLQFTQDDQHLQQVLAVVTRENEAMKGRLREMQASVTQQRTENDTRVADMQRRLDELMRENEQLKVDLRNSRRQSSRSANDVPPPAYDDDYIPPDV